MLSSTGRPVPEENNPFHVSGPVPVDYFVGRESEVSVAFDQIARLSHLAIYSH